MPAYSWLYDDKLDYRHTEGKIITLRKLGVPYPEGYETQAVNDAKAQAAKIAANLEQTGVKTSSDVSDHRVDRLYATPWHRHQSDSARDESRKNGGKGNGAEINAGST